MGKNRVVDVRMSWRTLERNMEKCWMLEDHPEVIKQQKKEENESKINYQNKLHRTVNRLIFINKGSIHTC